MAEAKNSVEIILPFCEAMSGEHINYQIMGGIGAAALKAEQSAIDPSSRQVIAPEDLFLPDRRDDGSLRDVDILILDNDPKSIAQVKEVAKGTIGQQLETSIFGLHSSKELDRQIKHPLGFLALKTFLSDRYVKPQDLSEKTLVYKVLFPFSVPLNRASLATWQVKMRGRKTTVPVSHPGSTILNYTNRSISGLRPKDAAKIEGLARNVFSKAPSIADWIKNGVGATQLGLSEVLHTLREPAHKAQPLVIGGKLRINPGDWHDLTNHQSFMVKNAPAHIQQDVLKVARAKSRLLHLAETNSTIVSLWQKYMESVANSIVKNQ